jgi:hypothetical protein
VAEPRGIEFPPNSEIQTKGRLGWSLSFIWRAWFNKLTWLLGFGVDVVLDPAQVAANVTALETVTIAGLTTDMRVVVNKPSHTSGIVIGGFYVTATDTLGIVFANVTGSAVNPGSETYRVWAARKK